MLAAHADITTPTLSHTHSGCRAAPLSTRSLPEDHTLTPFQDICIIKMINKAKFPVYLVCSKVTKKQYAMKVFPLDHEKPHKYFNNEIRFARLDHENIIKTVYVEFDKTTFYKGSIRQVSYILMDYAPNGDFFDLVNNYTLSQDTKLVRTYFKQLIKGLEYLHSKGVTHMDIKLENLLLGEDYSMKIADFDLSHVAGDSQTLARGTKCYRAPEVIRARCVNFSAADIYSAGIVLFIMKTGGIMPHTENTDVHGINFYELLYEDNERFWRKHSRISTSVTFEDDFKELFNAMTRPKQEQRATLSEIKNSKWYRGEVYTPEELKQVMKGYSKP